VNIMGASFAPSITVTPRAIPEVSRKPAKADLRVPTPDLRREIGQAIEHARREAGLTLDELASTVPAPDGSEKRDARQVRRWADGTERAQFDVLFASTHDRFVAALYERLAPLSRRYERVVEIRRTA
jgi:hypothetical protein